MKLTFEYLAPKERILAKMNRDNVVTWLRELASGNHRQVHHVMYNPAWDKDGKPGYCALGVIVYAIKPGLQSSRDHSLYDWLGVRESPLILNGVKNIPGVVRAVMYANDTLKASFVDIADGLAELFGIDESEYKQGDLLASALWDNASKELLAEREQLWQAMAEV